MNLERGKAKIKIESCVGKKTSSFLQNFNTAVNGEGREEQHGSNWLNAEEFHIVWFWKWNWIFFKIQIIFKAEKYALTALIRFFFFFVTQLYFWPFLFALFHHLQLKVLPRMHTACCDVSQPEMQQNKMQFYCRNYSAGEAHCRMLTEHPGCCYKSWKMGVLTRKSLIEEKDNLTTLLDFFWRGECLKFIKRGATSSDGDKTSPKFVVLRDVPVPEHSWGCSSVPSSEPFSSSILLTNKKRSFPWFSNLHLLSGLTQKKKTFQHFMF